MDKAAEIAARFAKLNPQGAAKAKPESDEAVPTASKPSVSEIAKRVADARKKVEEMAAKQRNVNPYLVSVCLGMLFL